MTTFIQWPQEQDAQFRALYFDIVGEEIQDSPDSINGFYVTGSSRIKNEHIISLQTEFPDAVFEGELNGANN